MNPFSNLLDGPMTVDPPQQPHLIVIGDQRLRLFSVDPKAMANRILLIVVPLKELASTVVTDPGPYRRLRVNVEHRPAGTANSPTGKPAHQVVLRHLHADDPIQRGVQNLQHFRQRLGLAQRPWKPVKDIAVSAIGSPQSLFDDFNDDAIRYERALRHNRLGCPSER